MWDLADTMADRSTDIFVDVANAASQAYAYSALKGPAPLPSARQFAAEACSSMVRAGRS